MDAARDLCAYVDASPSPYHAVAETVRRLESAGFSRLREVDAWQLSPGSAHYVIRGDASIIAFRVGSKSPVESGFHVIGAHTDSPNLRLKPQPATGKEGYAQLGVEVYGGVLLYTWLDRDLGIAGRLILDDGNGGVTKQLVRIAEPIARVASLAIHLDREVNDKGLILNKQTHLAPLLAMGEPQEALNHLMTRLAGDPSRVRGFDLGLYDLTAPTLGGQDQAFVFSARLDNLASCHAATSALVSSSTSAATQVIALFDHEEVGSGSATGAAGPFLEDVLSRIVDATSSGPSAFARAIAASFCISADMAHAVHPNHSDKHENKHMPRIGKGPVVKSNVQQRYATDGETGARFRALCRAADVPVQDFVTRTDLACGSTIGPITAARLGIATVDVGNPMLSMHSTREMCGAADVAMMTNVLARFFS
ncbi:MAG: M18 family aminopeptidase [Polyangiales bacterium]